MPAQLKANIMNKIVLRCFTLFIFFGCSLAYADGLVVDKVYHPYVLPFEKEFEWRFMSSQTDDGNRLGQRLGYGQGINENIAIEGYIIAERDEQTSNFEIQAYEIETRIMLTEQGEKWADWGLLIEVENQNKINNWEVAVGLIFEKEFENTSLTLNSFVIYEWGDNLDDEFELEFRAKYRYRWLAEIQPAIEIYTGENFFGVGPAFMGVHRIKGQEQIKWQVGFISEISQSDKDHTLRFSIEYEF